MNQEIITLNNWIKIPKLWFWTRLITREDAYNSVLKALSIWYRHIDTAEAYRNEIEVWRAIKDSWISRKEIFLTTKLHAESKTYEDSIQYIEESFKKLWVDYIDLMIIHSPQPRDKVNQSEDRFFKWNIEAYKALENYYKKWKIKAIWVSNFQQIDIENILNNCQIVPAVNQILCHISNTPFELISYCKSKWIMVEAYSPIAHWEILKNEKIMHIAEKYWVSTAQICVKYTLQLWLISLPKARIEEHMMQNFNMNFEILEQDMELLKNFDKIQNYWKSSFFPVYGGKI